MQPKPVLALYFCCSCRETLQNLILFRPFWMQSVKEGILFQESFELE
jgi:hypothetical protein